MKENQLDTFEELMLDHLAGKLSEDGKQKLLRFLKSDASYQQKYKEMARMRAKSLVGKFEQEKQSNYKDLCAKLGLKEQKKRFFMWRNLSQAAAVALLALTTPIAGYYICNDIAESHQEPVLCQMEVPLGSQTKVVLPDSSVVCLNSGSILKYDAAFLQRPKREVHLTGEGYFEVKKSSDNPFIVHANEISVKVLGTVFNVRSYPDEPEIKVSLIEGKVDVFKAAGDAESVILSPNEQLTYNKESGLMQHLRADALQASQWITGRLSFVNELLPQIMKDIERKYNVRIINHSQTMDKEIFSGSISSKLTVEEILDYIDVDNKYKWSRNGNTITITDR